MRPLTRSIIVLGACLLGCSTSAQTPDAPASPTGAPAAAARGGSSMAGEKGVKNEMKAHDKNEKAQKRMDNPHKGD